MRVALVPETRPAGRFLRFHAAGHHGIPPPRADRHPDWPFLIVEGRRRFCGLCCIVWNPIPGPYEPAKRGDAWWGEGDQKFFVDGEKFPSTVGTGTQEYFGCAWGCPDRFECPFHAPTVTQGNAGHQSLVRWPVADNVPLQRRFEGCLETYFPDDRSTRSAATMFWDLAPGGRHPIRLPAVRERHGVFVRPPLRAAGHPVLAPPRHGQVRTQTMQARDGGPWAGVDHLGWTGGQPSDRIENEVRAPTAGRHRWAVPLTNASDSAIVRGDLDGTPCSPPVDLDHLNVIRTARCDRGEPEWGTKPRRLGVAIVGANPKASPAYMFGHDVRTR